MTQCPVFWPLYGPPPADLLEASSILHDSMADFGSYHSEPTRSQLGVMSEITEHLLAMMRMIPSGSLQVSAQWRRQ